MYDPEDKDVLNTLAAIIVGGTLLLGIMFSCIGCSTTLCPECVPEIQTVEVKIPVPSCPDVQIPPPVVLPEYPSPESFIQENASIDEAFKAWYAEMSTTVESREEILRERISTLEKLLRDLPKSE